MMTYAGRVLKLAESGAWDDLGPQFPRSRPPRRPGWQARDARSDDIHKAKLAKKKEKEELDAQQLKLFEHKTYAGRVLEFAQDIKRYVADNMLFNSYSAARDYVDNNPNSKNIVTKAPTFKSEITETPEVKKRERHTTDGSKQTTQPETKQEISKYSKAQGA
jgi:hypothetical protein